MKKWLKIALGIIGIATDNSTIRQTVWTCDNTLQVVNYEIVNGGHTIPHPNSKLPAILGNTNQDLNAPKVIWAFFEGIKAQDLN
jgi:polyhydroxybutyrate depolymerase